MRPLLVVKVGGSLLDRVEDVALDALRYARSRGLGIVLVHGGGRLVDDYSRAMGIEPRYVVSPSGVRSRFTDARSLEVYVMVMAGLVAKRVVGRLVARGVRAVSVAGPDCQLLSARRKERIVVINERGRPQVVDGGYTGSITSVNVECLATLLKAFDVVVVSPVAMASDGTLLNVDGDQAAAALAAAARAEALVMLTDVEGVIIDGRVVRELRASEAEKLALRVGPGMNRKLLMAARAVRGGARLAVIAPGLGGEPVSSALRGERGTRVLP